MAPMLWRALLKLLLQKSSLDQTKWNDSFHVGGMQPTPPGYMLGVELGGQTGGGPLIVKDGCGVSSEGG